jgi:diaminopimelate epimerase
MKFAKYHALGNDYIVLDSADFPRVPSRTRIRLLCNRNFGIGSDGILWGPLQVRRRGDFGLRIFNPDGSEAEKSGNGLRIFSRYLWDRKLVGHKPFTISTNGGLVTAHVLTANRITVGMGRVSFHSTAIPVRGRPREVLNESLTANGRSFVFCAATIGNPHCVIIVDDVSEELARKYGPINETDPRFPNRTNVQFVRVLDRRTIQLEIWERGAGYTLASGSSSSAAAAVAHRLGLCDSHIKAVMPGGKLDIRISDDFAVSLTGSVTRVCDGTIAKELVLR